MSQDVNDTSDNNLTPLLPLDNDINDISNNEQELFFETLRRNIIRNLINDIHEDDSSMETPTTSAVSMSTDIVVIPNTPRRFNRNYYNMYSSHSDREEYNEEENNFDNVNIYFGHMNYDAMIEEVLNRSFESDIILPTPHIEEVIIFSHRYRKIKSKLRYKDEISCSICLSEYIDEDRIACNLKCKHIFHKECLREWSKISIKCPICRGEMEVKQRV